VKGGSQFALTESTGNPLTENNALRTIAAWKQAAHKGLTFYVNDLGHAWYESAGKRFFLTNVPEGFTWPTTDQVGT